MGETPKALSGAGWGLVLAVFMVVSSILFGRELGPAIGSTVATVYWAWRMHLPLRLALTVTTLTFVWASGSFYFFHVRQDAVGVVVMVACALIAFATLRPIRRAIHNAPK